MKKHILSMLLLFVFVVGLGTPAIAYGEGDSTYGLEFATAEDIANFRNMEIVGIGECPYASDAKELELDASSDISRARVPDLYIEGMSVYPIIRIEGETPLYVLYDVYRSQAYGASAGYQQFGGISLTSSQLSSVYRDIIQCVNTNPSWTGKSIRFIGWELAGLYHYNAAKSAYFEYEGSEGCINIQNPIKETVSTSEVNYVVRRDFEVPNGNYDGFYRLSVDGGFYTQQVSAGVGIFLRVNTDKA